MCPKKNNLQPADCPIKQLRLEAGLSQEALAIAIRVAVSTIRRWEQSNCEPTMTVRQMRKFCAAVAVRFDQLPEPLGDNLTERRRAAVLDYLRSHPQEINTVNLLSAKLNLNRQQVTAALEHLEFKKLIWREGMRIENGRGSYKNFGYKAYTLD
jgi:transcriptional regulator with XRE-family HTH domain